MYYNAIVQVGLLLPTKYTVAPICVQVIEKYLITLF